MSFNALLALSWRLAQHVCTSLSPGWLEYHLGGVNEGGVTSAIFFNGDVWMTSQGGHQSGDPSGHRDQTQPSLPDEWRGPNPATWRHRRGAHHLGRGGASGLQLQKGRGFVRLRTGSVTRSVTPGGPPGRHSGSAGEHPQRLGDVWHAVGWHRGADVWRLWLPPPKELSSDGQPTAPSPLLSRPEPFRRPSLSHREQCHSLHMRAHKMA